MSLFTQTQIPDSYFVGVINSEFISLYVDNFINNTSHFQINDARQLPIIWPSKEILTQFTRLVSEAISKKQITFSSSVESELREIQLNIDKSVQQLYHIN